MERLIDQFASYVWSKRPKDNLGWLFLAILFLSGMLVVSLAWLLTPHGTQCYGGQPWFLNCDYSLWYQASIKFPLAFKYGNILIHRPFFAFIGALFFWPTKLLLLFDDRFSELWVFVMTWRVQNIIFYFGLIYLAYQCGKLSWNRTTGFFLALLVAISDHNFAWVMQPINNVQGFFITFFTWWAVMDYLNHKDKKGRRLRLISYSFVFGCLMLGKAMYNLLGTILVAGMIFERKRWKEILTFFAVQALPLIVWLLFINLVLSTPYKNYEARLGTFYFLKLNYAGAYSVKDFILRTMDIMKSPLILSMEGLGWLATVMGLAYWGKEFFTRRWWVLVVYILMTNGLLVLSGFALIRHAPDYWPVIYGGLAYWLATIPEQFDGRVKKLVFILEVIILLSTMLIYFDPTFIQGRSIF